MFTSMSSLEQQLYFTLGGKNQRVFTLQDIIDILNISPQHARNLASKMVKKQVAERVKPGLFVRIPESIILDKQLYKEDAVLIAAKSFDKAFLSHYTALSFYGLAERYTTQIYVTIPQHQRNILYHEITIKYIHVIPHRFFGITTMEYSNEKIPISDQERTILDIVNKPKYAGGWTESIICLQNLEQINWNNLLSYVKRFDNKVLARRIGYILDNLQNISFPEKIKNEIKKYSGNNIYYFDSTRKGVLKQDWNIVVPRTIIEAFHA